MRTFGPYRQRNRWKAFATILQGIYHSFAFSEDSMKALAECLSHPCYALTEKGTQYFHTVETRDPWNDRIPAFKISGRYRRRYGKGFFVFMPFVESDE